jgi:hypothetical protein
MRFNLYKVVLYPFNNMDLGLDLLMNPSRKNGDHVSSRASSVKDFATRSEKSIRIDMTSMKNDDEQSSIYERVKVEEFTDEDDVDVTSESSYQSSIPQSHRQRHAGGPSGGPAGGPSGHRFRKPERAASSRASSVSNSDVSLGSLLAKGGGEGGKRRITEEDVIAQKREILYQFDRIEKKGCKLPKKFTLASSLDEMKLEYERVKNDRAVDNAVKFQRKCVLLVTSGLEFVNSKYDPLNIKLNGWSQSINDDIEEYDDIFEELYEKYKGKANMAPELRLLMALGGSAFMFHMTNSLFKNAPELGDVLKQNPNLRRQFAEATANTMKSQAESGGGGGGLFGNIAGMFGNMFSGGGPSAAAAPPPPQQPPQGRFNMKGPSNMEDILKEMENDNDRIEVMSTITSSEFTELHDDVSINNLIYSKKGKKANAMSLDI